MLKHIAKLLTLMQIVFVCSFVYFFVRASIETFALHKMVGQDGFWNALFQARGSTLFIIFSGLALLTIRHLQDSLTLWVIQGELAKMGSDSTND